MRRIFRPVNYVHGTDRDLGKAAANAGAELSSVLGFYALVELA